MLVIGVYHNLLCRLLDVVGKRFARIYPDREPISKPSARSMCDPRDLTSRGASAAAGPRDHRREHTPRSVPGGERNALQRTLDLMGKEEDRGSPFLIFPSNPSASTATAPPQRQRGRCCEDAGGNSLLKESFRLPARSSQKLCVSRSCYSVGREEHTVCNVIYFRPHWPLICLLLVFLCLSF